MDQGAIAMRPPGVVSVGLHALGRRIWGGAASQPKRPAHILWAGLIARIYEVFPLLCPICGGQMRIIAFITYSADIRKILEHIGAQTEPPRITPARGPPLWDGVDAQDGEGVEPGPSWDGACQAAPDFEADQRISG